MMILFYFILVYLQGVKDYADQQKRLQKEINSVLERNKDISRQREEEQRQLELKNQENARKLEEAARDIENSHEYIPSGDGIHRPKLLCIPHTHICPEHELDSPVLGGEFFLEASPPVATVTLAPPAGAELLSPQYCPNPKATAKKIFSVTRVTSPTNESGFVLPHLGSVVTDVINSPTQVHPAVRHSADQGPVIPQLCSPLATVELPTLSTTIPLTVNLPSTQSPDSLQKVLEEHTLVSYIQQIVDTSESEDKDACIESVSSETVANTDLSNNDSSSVIEDIDKKLSDNANLDLSSEVELLNNSMDNVENRSNTNDVQVNKIIKDTNGEKSNMESRSDFNTNNTQADDACDSLPDDTGVNKNSSASSGDESKSVSDVNGEHDCEVGDAQNGQIICSKTSNVDTACSSQAIVSNSGCDISDMQKAQPESLSEFNLPSLHVDDANEDDYTEEINGDYVDCVENDSSYNVDKRGNEFSQTSVDNESWDTVNKSDFEGDTLPCSDTEKKKTNNPDFHTNLTFNGLRQELASLIDEEGNSVPVSAPDVSNGSIPNAGNNNVNLVKY